MASKHRIILLLQIAVCLAWHTPALTAAGRRRPLTFPKIDRYPEVADYSRRGRLDALPRFDPNTSDPWQVDLRSFDLSALDLGDRLADLLYATFNDRTVWPPDNHLPQNFDWQRIMELGKGPGLSVRSLHARGITGKNVGIAIIDQTLLVDHQEYSSQLRLYEETDDIVGAWKRSQMHGAAVASIAVGRTVGVAPEADLYYMATVRGPSRNDFTYTAKCIRRFLQIDKQLPEGRKIRVLSMSKGWDPSVQGYHDVTSAAQEAKAAGMLFVCSSIEEVHGFKFHALGRAPQSDPNLALSYEPELWWAKRYYEGPRFSDRLLVPAGSRTTASPLGVDEYVFYRRGGWSWAIPYIAGVYALAAQADPAITPDWFWTLALETGQTIELDHQGEKMLLGPIVDPVALVDALQSQ